MIRSTLGGFLFTLSLSAQTIFVEPSTLDFGNVPVGQNVTLTYHVYGTNLVDSLTINAPAAFEISKTNGSGFTSQILLDPALDTTTIYVRFSPSTAASFDQDINHSSGEASTVKVKLLATSYAAEPTVPPTALNFSNIDSTSMSISWSPGNGNARVLVLRAGSEITSSPSDGQGYTANSTFGSGDQAGNGNYVVYNNSGTSVTVLGLQKQQTYYAALFEYNGTGGSENYLADSLSGSQITKSRAPVRIAQIPDTTMQEDFGVVSFGGNLNTYFEDSDSPLTFSVSAPPGITAQVLGNSIQLQSQTDSSGTYQLIVSAQDEFPQVVRDTFVVTVTAQNDAPRVVFALPDGSIPEDVGRIFIARLSTVFSDPEGDPLIFGAMTSDSSRLLAVVSNDSLYLQTVQDSNGIVAVYLTAEDPSMAEVRDTLIINVTPVSDSPFIQTALRDTTLDEDFGRLGIYRLSDFFKDIDNDTLDYSFSVVAVGVIPEIVGDSLYLNSLGNFFGTSTIIISAYDGTSSVEDTMEVVINNVNDVPRSLGFVGSLSIPEDAGIYFVALTTQIIVDDDDDMLSFSVTGSDTTLLRPMISNDSLYLLTTMDSSGSVFIYLTATDPSMTSVTDTFSVTITPVSDPPYLLTALRDTLLPQNFGKTFIRHLTEVFADIDNPVLTYQASSLTTGVTPSVSNDSLYLTAQTGFFGQCLVRVAASDGVSATADTFRVSVTDQQPPVVFLNALATPALDIVRFVVGADEAMSLLTVTVNGNEISMTNQNGVFFGDFTLSSDGPLSVVVTARDFTGNQDTLKRAYQVSSLDKSTTFASMNFQGNSQGYLLLRSLPAPPVINSLKALGDGFELLRTGSGPIAISMPVTATTDGSDPNTFARKSSLYEWTDGQWKRLTETGEGRDIHSRVEHAGVYRMFYDPEWIVVPEKIVLRQNYPNPFNPSTTIEYELPEAAHINISVYNILGQKVSTLFDGSRPAGMYQAVWRGTNEAGQQVSSGVYIYRIQTGKFIQSKKMILSK